MSNDVQSIVLQTSVACAALGVVLSPIPFADELLLVPVYGVMAARIGKAHGLSVIEVPWKPISGAIVAGLASRAAVNVTVGFIPGVAAVANAISAAALTRLLGAYADRACQECAASVAPA